MDFLNYKKKKISSNVNKHGTVDEVHGWDLKIYIYVNLQKLTNLMNFSLKLLSKLIRLKCNKCVIHSY